MNTQQQKEIQEAISAIKTTLSYLEQAQEYLNGAGSWGVADIIGGGFFTTMMKRDKMGKAQYALQNAKNSIIRLKKELQDVDAVFNADLNVDALLNFADYFLDGPVVDWLVQSKISSTKKQVQEAMEKLKKLKSKLTFMSIYE